MLCAKDNGGLSYPATRAASGAHVAKFEVIHWCHGAMVKQLAAKLRLPTSGSIEDVRQLVDTKVQERGH